MNRKITPVKSRDCSLRDFNFRQADWLFTRSRSRRGEGTARGWAAESAINHSTTLTVRAHVRWRQIIGAASSFAREKEGRSRTRTGCLRKRGIRLGAGGREALYHRMMIGWS